MEWLHYIGSHDAWQSNMNRDAFSAVGSSCIAHFLTKFIMYVLKVLCIFVCSVCSFKAFWIELLTLISAMSMLPLLSYLRRPVKRGTNWYAVLIQLLQCVPHRDEKFCGITSGCSIGTCNCVWEYPECPELDVLQWPVAVCRSHRTCFSRE